MAIMIPDSCPSSATVGEKRTYGLIQDLLPDNFTVWFEPVIQGRYPDFIVLADLFGLLVLEVKGWYPGQIVRVDDQNVELLKTEAGQERIERHKNPIRQVRDYLFGLMDELGRPEFSILRNTEGDHQGKLCFPCGYGVLLTNITRAQRDEAGLSAIFPADRVICKDELSELEHAGDRETIKRLRRLFPAPFSFDPLTDDQLKTIKGVIHKEVIVKTRPATSASVPAGRTPTPDALTLEVLDARQEQAARALSAGHHVVFGVAGSGKTVLLLARARLIARQDPSRRVLILCYNRALAAYLRTQLDGEHGLGNVEVLHFHSWVARRTGLYRRDDERFDDYEQRVVATLLDRLEMFPESGKYDAILIDEGHDFAPDWLRCVTGQLKGGQAGDLMIAVDGAQSLYGRSASFTWKSVGVKASGRARRLSRNYRNTKQILEFAWQVAQSAIPDDTTSEAHVRVLPTKASRRGPLPVYRGCASVAEEHALIVDRVRDFRARGLAESEIAVLYPRRERDRIDALCGALRELGEVCWVSNESDPGGGVASLSRQGVRLMTIHAAKGLEFPAVIVSALDLLPSPIEPDEVRDSNLLYVGLTRAMDHLVVTWTGRSEFTDRVPRSNRSEAI